MIVTVKSIIVALAASYGEKWGFGNLLVIYNLKVSTKSDYPSNLIKIFFPLLKNCFSKTGSSIVSNSFSTF